MKDGHYLPGEIAKMFDITIETVRYYNKIGLLDPARNQANNYRYFSQNDVGNVHSVTLMRSFGIPIEKIRAFFETGDLRILSNQIAENQRNIHDQIIHLYRQQLELERFQKQLEDVDTYSPGITLRESPKWYTVCESSECHPAELNRSFREIMADAECLPSYAYLMAKENFLAQEYQYHRYCLLLEVWDGHAPDSAGFIPSHKCAYYVFNEKVEQLTEAYGKLFRWIEEKKLSVADNIVERFILSTPHIRIMEIWVPIGQES